MLNLISQNKTIAPALKLSGMRPLQMSSVKLQFCSLLGYGLPLVCLWSGWDVAWMWWVEQLKGVKSHSLEQVGQL